MTIWPRSCDCGRKVLNGRCEMRFERALAIRPGNDVLFCPAGHSADCANGDWFVIDDSGFWEWAPMGEVLKVTRRGGVLVAVLGLRRKVIREEWVPYGRIIQEFRGPRKKKPPAAGNTFQNNFGY